MFGVKTEIGADHLGLALDLVPEGPNDRSQAIYCLEQVLSRFRPAGHGLILTPG